jgi:hypothetical protein
MHPARDPETPRPRSPFNSRPISYPPSNRSEGVVQALVEQAHDDRINALQRAEAVCALKSFLQADWDHVATVVGMSTRSVLAMASLLKLPEPVRLALRQRELDLRHGAALARLLDHDGAMVRLFQYVRANPTVTGDVALRIAGAMLRDPDADLDEARRLAEVRIGGREPLSQVKALLEALQSIENVNLTDLTTPDQHRLIADLNLASVRLARVQERLTR